MTHAFEALRSRDAQAYSDAVAAATAPLAPRRATGRAGARRSPSAPVFVATPIGADGRAGAPPPPSAGTKRSRQGRRQARQRRPRPRKAAAPAAAPPRPP